MTEDLLIERDAAVATITLDRPDRRNALSLALIEALTTGLAEVGGDPLVGAVVLGARGPVFCAGHDLVEMRGRDEDFFQGLFEACTRMMLTIRHLPQPVIARVQGMASAGGCHLVAACDLVVASEDAQFAVPGPRIGLPGTTAMVEIARIVGTRRAMELLLAGEPIDALEARRWGLVNHVVPAKDLETHTSSLAHRIASASRTVVAEAKQGVYEAVDSDLASAYGRARDVMARSSAAPDAQEGIAAFLEKRRPTWPSEEGDAPPHRPGQSPP
jgi:enoyl-CoA hydratase/carnithine racemase